VLDPGRDDELADFAGDFVFAAVDLEVPDFELPDFDAADFLAVAFPEVDLEVEDFFVAGILIPPSNFKFRIGLREGCNRRTAQNLH